MKQPDTIYNTNDLSHESKRFWKKAFLFYVAAEALFMLITYLATRLQCDACVKPVLFYVVQFLCGVLLTLLIWSGLYKISKSVLWKQVAGNIVIFLIYYFLWIGCLYLLYNSGISGLSGEGTAPRSLRNIIYWSWFDIGRYVVVAAAFYVLRFYFSYRSAAQQRIAMAVINKDMQVNLLKQQLSPHFYFNTLNNLYGLSRANSDGLPAALDQLSSIMHYVIEDCNRPKVLLKQEVNFLQSYIELEKLRYEENTRIEMNVSGTINGQTIMPLLLVQFVENAFKHGMKEKSENNWMKVKLEVQDKHMHFQVDNSFYGELPAPGIGMRSVRHILDLQYRNNYELHAGKEENSFSVTLKLNLS